ncbi:hypothetical protein O3G_MSEX015343 [Manduca sexta]|uniref:Uncharacterized protein n=1 Tax=Manduca sexta TaxID=7130 RepID=A0A921ZZA9_MANSE|nr:hypothetical protein O3G_MSEX015343 [Manduca sexta]
MRLTSEYIGRSNDDDNTRADARRKMSWRRRLSVTLYESRMGILRRSPPATLRHTASNLTVTSRFSVFIVFEHVAPLSTKCGTNQ